jgi:5-methylcytosine-specific restriction endonuclease McrA
MEWEEREAGMGPFPAPCFLLPTKRPMEREQQSFIISVSPEQLQKEREKAGDLRRTQWWKRQLAKGVCYYCHKKVAPAELTMDHIVALIRGGKSTRGNSVPACRECNSRKKYLLPIEWDQYVKEQLGIRNSE